MTAVLGLAAAAILASVTSWDEAILHRAMSDELSRSMDSLALPNARRPYYLEYRVRESHVVVLRAEFGALVEDRQEKARRGWVDVRVGTPQFDNTNFLARTGLVGAEGIGLPLEDDYGALRDALWLVTDRAYKLALEQMAQKEAYVENRTVEDYPGDLSPVEATTYLGEHVSLDQDWSRWREVVKDLAAVFKRFPSIQESGVSLLARTTNQHFINSENSHHVKGSGGFLLTAVAHSQCADGMKVADRLTIWWAIGQEPSRDHLFAETEELAERVAALSEAPRGEDYVGPAIITGQGAGEFWAQVMLANLASPRTPLGQASFKGVRREPPLVRKLRRRILPIGIDAYDDPSLDSYEGSRLVGGYPVDDDGVTPSLVHLVEDGRLVGLLMSRIPIQELRVTNGHGRGTGEWVDGQPSNTVIADRDAVPVREMLGKLAELCRAIGLPYGLIVERISPGWWADTGPSGWFGEAWPYEGPGLELLGDPIVAYRVWIDEGRWELVRGLEFADVTVRALKDVLVTGDSCYVHHYLTGPRGSPPRLPASVVAPPILLEEAELRRKDLEEATLPYLAHPSFQ